MDKELMDFLSKLRAKLFECEKCPYRFKCFTINTAAQPKKLEGINIRPADCCLRCKHSKFPKHNGYDSTQIFGIGITYKAVGTCTLHNILIHQASVCDSFEEKANNNSIKVNIVEAMMETLKKKKTGGVPYYCIAKGKYINE